ncbi:hypothetical protein AWH62_13545 [Maricaulis sp. W15]|uniref:hypothetical protein n=1 Tax=Maricaulis sp. W15 TaxID=1772333 RepID=UPI000948D083|nr:hypothetical protein [Maricaulis sp. W15]OLF71076.1 hypothetical protein AWH62_13545 [Maricaulis sp. W15]
MRTTHAKLGLIARTHHLPTQRLPAGLSVRSGLALISLLASLGLTAPALAQDDPQPAQPLPGEALAGLVGEWEGSGWSMTQTGERETFDIFERVESVGGGRAVMIRGLGYAPAGVGREGDPVHDAGGYVTLGEDGYRMLAVALTGGPESYEMVMTDGGFNWTIPLGPTGHVAFEAVYDETSWTETGQYCNPSGACFPTLSMTLTRVAD